VPDDGHAHIGEVTFVEIEENRIVTEGASTILVLRRVEVAHISRVGRDPGSVEVDLKTVVVVVIVTDLNFRRSALERHEGTAGAEAITQAGVANVYEGAAGIPLRLAGRGKFLGIHRDAQELLRARRAQVADLVQISGRLGISLQRQKSHGNREWLFQIAVSEPGVTLVVWAHLANGVLRKSSKEAMLK